MKSEFEIPLDIKNDLVYCQRALANHIMVHQKVASCASMVKVPDTRFQKSMKLIEKEIVDIGDEQKLLFNRLRFLVDYHQITRNAKLTEREKLTQFVREELVNLSRSNTGEVRPMNVLPRLSSDKLLAKYLRSEFSMDDDSGRDNSSGNTSDSKPELNFGSDEEKLEILQNHEEQKVYAGPRQKSNKQNATNASAGQSLLKPMYQRQKDEIEPDVEIRVVRPEVGIKPAAQETKKQPVGISLVRMRLSEALLKVKNANKTPAAPTSAKAVSPKNTPEPLTVKCNSPLSLSQSSGSSGESVPFKDEQDSSEMGQEGFLKLFGLYTPAYTAYLLNRRPQRKKRSCTSTERGDFHYGRFELFERQFANKRNKRQFLYSPPATRAKRRNVGAKGAVQRVAKEEVAPPKKGKGIKSNASSSSSLSSNASKVNNSEKVCLTCYKRNNLLQCQRCCAQYHAACHNQSTEIVTRRTFCPFCVRRKSRKVTHRYSTD